VSYRWSKSKDGWIGRAVVFLSQVGCGASQQAGGSLVVMLAVDWSFISSALLQKALHATTVMAIAADMVRPAPEQPNLRNTMIRSSHARRRLKKFNMFVPSLQTGEVLLAAKTFSNGCAQQFQHQVVGAREKAQDYRKLAVHERVGWREPKIGLLGQS
jgi:hypothetical protein